MEIQEKISFSDSVSISVRTNFTIPHLFAACRLSKENCQIEQSHQGETWGSFGTDIVSCSLACILECVAVLESYINELFVDRKKYFEDRDLIYINTIWELIEQKSILDKYDMALLLLKANPFNKGERPYQDIKILIKLRNSLIHFKPEWDDDQQEHAKISKQLKNRFPLSPFMNEIEPIFPKRWTSSGCTIWAVSSTITFIDKFETLCSIEHKLDPFRDRLNYQ